VGVMKIYYVKDEDGNWSQTYTGEIFYCFSKKILREKILANFFSGEYVIYECDNEKQTLKKVETVKVHNANTKT
jgi:hypothetical protein